MPAEPLAATLDRLLERAQAADRIPSAAAAVFRDGEVIWERALGLADVERGEAATPAHAYRIGSITKTFTAVGILQLRDAGRLSLDDRLSDLVPGVPEGPTVRLALTHAGGLQREPPGEIWETMRPPSREELLARLPEVELVLRPGEQFHYSNLVFALLGEVLVGIGGISYESYLRTRILDPLGLPWTQLRPEGPAATGYYVDPWSDEAEVEPDPRVTETTAAAGWLWSTVGDLARWGDFLCTGREDVLAPSTLDEMARVRVMADEEHWTVGFGLGVELYRRGDRVFVGHGGAMPGFLASLVAHRPERTGAAVLFATSAHARPGLLALDLTEAALEQLVRDPSPWAPAATPPEIRPLLGPWWTEGEEIVLSWRDGVLQADLVHGPEGRKVSYFEPLGDDRWRCVRGRERGEVLRVVREGGVVTKLYFATYPLTRSPQVFGRS